MNSNTPNPPQSTPRNKHRLWIAIGIALAVVLGMGILFFTINSNRPGNSAQNPPQQNQQKSDEELARSIQPCELLTDSERAKFNLGVGELDDRNIRGCDWDSLDEYPNTFYTSSKIYPSHSLDKMPQWESTTPEPLTIGSHQAHFIVVSEASVSYGVCAIDIAIGPTRSATIRLTANGKVGDKPDKYCDIVRQLAALIEPKLP